MWWGKLRDEELGPHAHWAASVGAGWLLPPRGRVTAAVMLLPLGVRR